MLSHQISDEGTVIREQLGMLGPDHLDSVLQALIADECRVAGN
jgi:hypothetical protein